MPLHPEIAFWISPATDKVRVGATLYMTQAKLYEWEAFSAGADRPRATETRSDDIQQCSLQLGNSRGARGLEAALLAERIGVRDRSVELSKLKAAGLIPRRLSQ